MDKPHNLQHEKPRMRVTDIIDIAAVWLDRTPDGAVERHYEVYLPKTHVHDGELHVTASELRQVHPDLPRLLAALHPASKIWCDGETVRASLERWTKPHRLLDLSHTNAKGNRITRMACVYAFEKLVLHSSTREVTCEGVMIDHEHLTDNQGKLLYAHQKRRCNITTSYDALENNFPGWEARYAFAQSMDYSPTQSARLALPIDTPQALPDIVFPNVLTNPEVTP